METAGKRALWFLAGYGLLIVLLLPAASHALTVSYDYAIEFNALKDTTADSPFESLEDLALTGTLVVEFAERSRKATVLDNRFIMSWVSGSYESGGASVSKYSENIQFDGSGQDIFRFQDQSTHADFGQYAFDRLRLDVMIPVDDSEGQEEVAAFASLDQATRNSFEIRFVNGPDKLTYSGYVAFLEPHLATLPAQGDLSAVPLPYSSVSILIGCLFLWSLSISRRRKQSWRPSSNEPRDACRPKRASAATPRTPYRPDHSVRIAALTCSASSGVTSSP